MTSDDLIKNTVKNFILSLQDEGDHAGGSGHKSHVTIEIDSIIIQPSKSPTESYKYVAKVKFTKIIESEFTYYPDNPPIEEEYSQLVYINEGLKVTGFASQNLESSNYDIDLLLEIDENMEEEKWE